MKLGIRKVKTWDGLKYGVVEVGVTSTRKKAMSSKEEELKEKYKNMPDAGEDVLETKNGLALFPYDAVGLEGARELKQKLSN